MTDPGYREYCLGKYDGYDPLDLINRKLLIHKQLEKPPRTYAVYSDLHGSYEKYLHWLKNGLGYYQISVAEVLGDSYAASITECFEKLLLIMNRSRFDYIEAFVDSDEQDLDVKAHFFEPVPVAFIQVLEKLEELGLTRRRVLLDAIKLLHATTRGDERRIIKMVPTHYLENILKLFHQNDEESFEGLVKGIVEHETIYHFMLSLIIRLVVNNAFDKHINLGDTFDRGEGADKLIKLYRSIFGDLSSDSPLHYIWGNHDILWLGAGIGNPILCAEALRISIRYNNVDFLSRYGFDLSKLYAAAEKTYQLTPTGSYLKAKDLPEAVADRAKKATKYLLMLQMKTTLRYLSAADEIPGDIEYGEELERHKQLLALLPAGIKEDPVVWQEFMAQNPLWRDAYYPTINPDNPMELTAEEQDILDDLVHQFTTLPRLQQDIGWMFKKGETYRVVDNTLYFHAAIPSHADMSFATIKGRGGKELLDFIQRDLKRIALKHEHGEEVTLREKMLFWYLWCGKDSPFFCKSKMATLERSLFHKEAASEDPLTSHSEVSNPYYKNIRRDEFLTRLLHEFHAERVCMGHTPIKTVRQAVLSESIQAFIVDGGASEAYGDRGAVLINTPDYAYLTFQPSLDELIQAEKEVRLPPIQVKQLEERGKRKLRHMEKGYFLEQELRAIDELLDSKLADFKRGYFYQPNPS